MQVVFNGEYVDTICLVHMPMATFWGSGQYNSKVSPQVIGCVYRYSEIRVSEGQR